MKRCPECGREYDNSMMFCLDDGAELLYGPASGYGADDEPATAFFPGPARAGGLSSAVAAIESKTARLHAPETARGHTTGRRYKALIAAAILVVVATVGYGIFRYTVKDVRTEVSFQKAKLTRLTTTGKASAVAISPDGKFVAHVQDDGGQQSLWTRQVATQSNVQIIEPSATTYSGLTFSPDGTYIYYTATSQEFTQQVLFQVPTLGGTPKRLVEQASTFPVSFSPDGKQFAFVRPAPGKEFELMIANADGTNERKLITHGNRETIAAPAWSPDGTRIVYLVRDLDRNDDTIFEALVVDGVTKPLTAQRWFRIGGLTWLADGSGLLMLATPGQTLDFQIWHFSYSKIEARQLTNDLNNYLRMSLAADSKTLAVVQSEKNASIWTAPATNASHARRVTFGSGKADTQPAWTPDDRIVFESYVSGEENIWIVAADGSGAKQLTANARLNAFPTVSPDGRHIVFMSDRSGAPHLWRMNIDGSGQQQFTNGVTGENTPQFSPDGRFLVYFTPLGKATVWKMPAGGGEPTQLTNKFSRSPTISPDGKLVAYFYRDENAPWRIAVAPLDGGEPIKTFDFSRLSSAGLRWTPDGRSIAFVDTNNGVSNIVAQPLDGGPPKQLTDFGEMGISSFDYSRDGKQLALSRGTISNDVVLINNFLGGNE